MSLYPQTPTETKDRTALALEAERIFAAAIMDDLIRFHSSKPAGWKEEQNHYAITDVFIDKATYCLECLKSAGEQTKRLRRLSALLKTIEDFRSDMELNPISELEWDARAGQISSAALEAGTAIRQSVMA